MHSSLSNGGSFVFCAALWWCSAVMPRSHSSALWVPSCLIICHRRPRSFDMPPAASQNRAGDYRRRGPFKASPRRSIIPFTPPTPPHTSCPVPPLKKSILFLPSFSCSFLPAPSPDGAIKGNHCPEDGPVCFGEVRGGTPSVVGRHTRSETDACWRAQRG